ncbi:hypothetical protein QFC22_001646 [Naganishia vaughanmartiniae]|uniref:Uncharacterized protein n=1 Tax=Naganishia vaughanmartiniae TaxID=1424756 RepID=A0ACC2XE82_9TREE|nr:hypothetical protein QFC22_001646 [Naganishia vaughanmartiniae]
MDPIPPPISVSEPYFTLNPIHFSITTTSPSAQQWFDRGLTLCYAFNHEEAMLCFYQCLAHDPNCVMAHWGIAYSLGANYNKTWELFAPGEVDASLPKIKAALHHIDQLAPGSELEMALIRALKARMPEDITRRDYGTWNIAYATAMQEVYAKFPESIDVTAFYADAMMILTPWRLWDLSTGGPAPNSRAVEIQAVLEHAMKHFPDADRHPGILHFYIHLMEMSPDPEKALPPANKLFNLVPDAGHLQHMPSHIYFLVGDYQRASYSNLLGIAADAKYLEKRGPGGFYLIYRLHNMQFIVYSAMYAGQYELAMRYVDMIEQNVPEELLAALGHFIEATYTMRSQVYVRFGRWEEIKALKIPSNPSIYPLTIAFTHWSKAIAYSATRDVPSAEKERDLYLSAYEKVPATSLVFPNSGKAVLDVGTAFLHGELEYRKANYPVAFAHLEESIKRYDSLIYCEPWSWLTPVRHAYAALKLEQGHTEQALKTYFDDLGINDTLPRAHQHPNNVWALTGAYECLIKLGRTREASIIRPLLRTATATADVDIKVSCFCRIDDIADGKDLVEQGEEICCAVKKE